MRDHGGWHRTWQAGTHTGHAPPDRTEREREREPVVHTRCTSHSRDSGDTHVALLTLGGGGGQLGGGCVLAPAIDVARGVRLPAVRVRFRVRARVRVRVRITLTLALTLT